MAQLLITSDIHLDDRPEHEYRWRAFDRMKTHAQRLEVAGVLILGDLVDIKDGHPARFVNRVVKEAGELAELVPVWILMGNHDYVDSACPFFHFLNRLPNVQYIREPRAIAFGDDRVLMVPHTDWHHETRWRQRFKLSGPEDGKPWNLICAHQTFAGAVASNGQAMKGTPLVTVSKHNTGGARVIGGDIHVPQKTGNVMYVGSPHPVRFGDVFDPRMLVWDTAKQSTKTVHCAGLKRVYQECDYDGTTATPRIDNDLSEGDHVKIRVHADSLLASHWPDLRKKLRAEVEATGAVVFGCELKCTAAESEATEAAGDDDNTDPLAAFCEAHDVSAELRDAGKKYL